MSFININNEIEDAFYRYKMPDIHSQFESSGNGIKTSILNINEIASSLQRDISEISKMFNVLLTTNSKYKEKRLILNGKFELNILKNVLTNYINIFILCKRCHLPETYYHVKKKHQKIYKLCNACGYKK